MIKKIFSFDKIFFIRVYGSIILSFIIDIGLFVLIVFIGIMFGIVVFEIFIIIYLLKLVLIIFNVLFGYIVKLLY